MRPQLMEDGLKLKDRGTALPLKIRCIRFFLFYFLHHDSFNIVAESSVNYFVDIHFIYGQFHYTDFLFFR